MSKTKSRKSVSVKVPAKKRVIQGKGGETHQQAEADSNVLTTNQGVRISDNQNQLKAFARGPVLLEDFVLREKIFHFDHERIPERIVHARGSAAHGFFELYESLKDVTTADIFQRKGEKTPVFARFSTVAGGAGSVDTPRDVRGFAVKFYTKQGNWDLVGNNIPVFFIQDAMKFPDLVHAVKMESDRGFPQAATAHDTFWDFVSLMPESTHMVMWAMSDRTLPRTLAHMEGFGVHTFRFINDKGKSTFVKFHWRPKLGVQSTIWDETVKIAGADPDFHRRTLFESIDRGDFPEWELGVQLFDEKFASKLPYDVLDATKLIPEEILPLRIVGRMVLNRNPDNFFAETEQAAYCPANIVPGIDFSNDPLLQGRLFSYLDTQLKRLGSTNFNRLPINQPKGCPFHNFQRDGHMQTEIFKGRANYEPNSLSENNEDGGPRECPVTGFKSFAESSAGEKGRIRPELFGDHYSQAKMFFNSLDEAEQNHVVSAFIFELSKVKLAHIRKRMLANLVNVDKGLSERVAKGLGMAVPGATPAQRPIQDLKTSPALRVIGREKDTLNGRVIGILIAEGSDAKMLETLKGEFKKKGAHVVTIAPKIDNIILSDKTAAQVDEQLAGFPSVFVDAIAVILSAKAVQKLSSESAAIQFVMDAFGHLKSIGYSKDAKPLLEKAGVQFDQGITEIPSPSFLNLAKKRFFERESKVRTIH